MPGFKQYMACWLLLLALFACRNKPREATKITIDPAIGSNTITAGIDTTGSVDDEKSFLAFFTRFQQAVKKKDSASLKEMIRFPLQTSIRWTDEDLRTSQIDKEEGKLGYSEFHGYYNQLFNSDVLRVMPKLKEDALYDITDDKKEDYYRTVREGLDSGAKVYEVYAQFPQPGGKAESYFGFVFGRVQGQYKIIAYYGKWPVKG